MLISPMSAPVEIPKRSASSDPSPGDIDRYGDLCQKVDLFAPVLEEQKLLKEKIEEAVASRPGDSPQQVEGARYQLQLSARRNERTITDKRKLFTRLRKQLGIDGFLSLISIPLGEGVDKNIPSSEQKLYVVEERTGSRSIKVVPKRPAPLPAA